MEAEDRARFAATHAVEIESLETFVDRLNASPNEVTLEELESHVDLATRLRDGAWGISRSSAEEVDPERDETSDARKEE